MDIVIGILLGACWAAMLAIAVWGLAEAFSGARKAKRDRSIEPRCVAVTRAVRGSKWRATR